ncbi:hypothetical protein BJF78_21250 [Pseudonocardia sp. CNS-139]|nr:hypothetical protein BJF78_21250 [Pseudonocardia sp. CNS-139]
MTGPNAPSDPNDPGEPDGPPAGPGPPRGYSRRQYSRRHRLQVAADWLLAVAGLGIAAWQLAPKLGALSDVGGLLARLDWAWLGLAVALGAASLLAYGDLHRRFLRSTGTRLGWPTVQAVTAAGNAVSLTIPTAGAAVGAGYTVHALQQRGVSFVPATWAVAMAGVATGVVFAALAPVALSWAGVVGPVVGVGGSLLLVFLVPGGWLWLEHGRPGGGTGSPRPRSRLLATVERRLTDLRHWLGSHRMGVRQWTLVLVTALATWLLDCLALAACLAATGAGSVPVHAIVLGYLAAQASIMVGLTPGGTGPAEAGLLAALVGSGAGAADAALAVVLYRLITWIWPAMVGWVLVLVLAGRGRRQAAAPVPDETGPAAGDDRA